MARNRARDASASFTGRADRSSENARNFKVEKIHFKVGETGEAGI